MYEKNRFLKKKRVFSKYDVTDSVYVINENLSLNMFEVADTYELLDGLIENESQKRSVERFPYWAEVWPSSIGLAKWFNENQKKIIQPDGWVRELGCGVGLVGISLAVMGWSVEATDYVADALVFSAENAKVNQIANKHRVAYLDWRNPVGEICNCMVGSDIIYEKRNHLLIIRLIESQLASGGDLYLSDPKRVASRGFVDLLIKNGYRHSIDSINVKHGSLNNAIDIHHFVKP